MSSESDNKQATLALGTQPVGKLLFQYALPAIIAMVASSMYNIIDRAFIGQVVGPIAISGLAITFPFMNLSGAFGAAVGVGSATAISLKLGQKDYLSAEEILGNTVTLNLIIGFGFAVICFLFLDPILYFFGASKETIPYARSFMQIILLGNVVTHMYFGMNAVLRAASKPRQAMTATIFTVLMNIALDVLFILVLHWGIRGAATATVLSQTLALIYQLKLFSNKKELLHFKPGIYKLKRRLVKNIVSVGISPFLMNLCACLVIIFINNQLVRYGGDLSVGSYGIASAVSTMFVMIVMGLNQGMQPIAGYNYGAQKLDRVMRVLKLAIMSAIVIWTIGWLISMFFPEYIARIFTNDKELIKLSVFAIRVDMLVTPVVGLQMVVTNFFQCIGKVKVSIFLNNQLVRYGGDLSVGSYGIASAVSTMFVMIVMGLNQGMQPIAGYNYGAQKLERVMRVLKLAILSAIVIWTIGWLISMFFPEYIARIFTNDKELIKLSVFAIRVDMLVTPVVGLQMVVTNFFQCIGKVKVSIFLSLSRQLLFLLPLLYTLPLFFGVNGVWYSLPVSDFIAANVAFVMLLTYMRKFKKQLKLSENG